MGLVSIIKNIDESFRELNYDAAKRIAESNGLDYHSKIQFLSHVRETEDNYSICRAALEPFYAFRKYLSAQRQLCNMIEDVEPIEIRAYLKRRAFFDKVKTNAIFLSLDALRFFMLYELISSILDKW